MLILCNRVNNFFGYLLLKYFIFICTRNHSVDILNSSLIHTGHFLKCTLYQMNQTQMYVGV